MAIMLVVVLVVVVGGGVNSNYKHVCGCFSICEPVDDVALLYKKIIAGRLVIVFLFGRLLMISLCW